AARTGHERTAALRRRHLKAIIELADVVLPQKPVGLVHGRDRMQPQLLRQPSLPGAKAALATSPRLRRVGRDHLHSQLVQGASHLRQAMGIDLTAYLGRQPEMAATVAIES